MSQPPNSNFGPPFGTDFIPNLQYVTDITNAVQAVVTFTTDHRFFLWEWISFRIPPANGMIQLNNQKALIVGVTSMTVTIDVDTLDFYPFVDVQDPQVPCVAVPAGSGIAAGMAMTILDDAFDNQPIL